MQCSEEKQEEESRKIKSYKDLIMEMEGDFLCSMEDLQAMEMPKDKIY